MMNLKKQDSAGEQAPDTSTPAISIPAGISSTLGKLRRFVSVAAMAVIGSTAVPTHGENTVISSTVDIAPQVDAPQKNQEKEPIPEPNLSREEKLERFMESTYEFPLTPEEKARINEKLYSELINTPTDDLILLALDWGNAETVQYAWSLFDQQPNPSNETLRLIVKSNVYPYSLYAADKLMGQSIEKEDLYAVLHSWSGDHYLSKIMQMILDQDPTPKDLMYIWKNGDQWAKDQAKDALVENADKLSEMNLEDFLLSAHQQLEKEQVNKLATLLLKKTDSSFVTERVLSIVDDENIEAEAVEKTLASKDLSLSDLLMMVGHLKSESLQNKVLTKIKQFNQGKIDWSDLKYLPKGSGSREAVQLYLSSGEKLDYALDELYDLQDEEISNQVSEMALAGKRINNPASIIQVIKYGPQEYQKKAAEKVLNGYLPKGAFRQMLVLDKVAQAFPEYKGQVAEKMFEYLEKTEDNAVLADIIRTFYQNEKIKKRASEKIFARGRLDKKVLLAIAQNIDEKYRATTYEQLFSYDLSNNEIEDIIEHAPLKYRDILTQRIMIQHPDNHDLLFVWNYNPNLRSKAIAMVQAPKMARDEPAFNSYLMITSNDQQQQSKLVAKMSDQNFNGDVIPYLRLDVWEPEDWNQQLISAAIANSVVPNDEMREFILTFSNPLMKEYFRSNKSKFTYAQIFSVTLATIRYVTSKFEGDFSDSNIKSSLRAVMAQREKFEQLSILDENTTLIHFTHDEYNYRDAEFTFNNKYVVELAKQAGVKKIHGENLQGPQLKPHILNAISSSEGPTTIWFSGHGGEKGWALTKEPKNVETQEDAIEPWSINYRELGDALIESKNISNIILITDTCFSYNYIKNLEEYIISQHNALGLKPQMPTIITAPNKNKKGVSGAAFASETYGSIILNTRSVFLDAVYHAHTPGKPLTGADLLSTESMIYNWEDPSFHVKDPDSDSLIEISANTSEGDQESKAA